ncbi:MAG: hypothetical protein ACO25B_07055 [Chitinophagaceae bacterium]
MNYPIRDIARIIDAPIPAGSEGHAISHILLDSRNVFTSADTLFFALKGPR